MHTALIANSAWLDHEPATLGQLTAGLIDAGTRVMQVLPRRRAGGDTLPFAGKLGWDESRSDRTNRKTLGWLGDTLAEHGVGLLHALDGGVWDGTLRLSQTLGVPAVLNVNATPDAERAAHLARKLDPERTAFACATRPMADAVAEHVPNGLLVQCVPPGVHLAEPTSAHDPDTLCIVASVDGRHDDATETFLASLRGVAEVMPSVQVFFDVRGRDTHTLWRAIDRLGLSPHCTLTPKRQGQREILLNADALALPQALGQAQPLTLRAMAHALPVIAVDDPALDYLLPGQTARVLQHPTPAQWADALGDLALKPERARDLGRSAREWVGRHRLAATQVDQLLHLYRSITGETLPFGG